MSKQSDAKKKQNYNPRPDRDQCSNCKHFVSDMETVPSMYGPHYVHEKNLRCAVGGFKVLKRGICSEHKFKGESE